MEHISEKRYPVSAKDYKLCEEVGEGGSATVYKALCIPLNETVAIKVLDLERCNNDLDDMRREEQTMSLIDHPNVLQAHCSFTTGHSLWVVMPYMGGGSCLHIMKSAYPEGFEEPIIATLLHETLKALVYLHAHGQIHRDVKAGNILIDSNGAVKLADSRVSACMFDTGDRQRSRNTFVGTSCWMAPEVMQQLHGYDFKADIWSFGITALELAHGHASFSNKSPMKVLLMTLQSAPPGLDYERDMRFSKSFKEMVAACLVKDPKKRPTSEKLLKHHFFKHAQLNEYVARTILDGLDPLEERFRVLKAKEANLLVQKKALYEDKEQLSQQEYIKGISAWNFNLEDLKSQAALIQDFDGISNAEDPDMGMKQRHRHNNVELTAERLSHERANHSTAAPSHEDGFSDLHDLESSLPSFAIKPLQALKGCFDVGDDDVDGSSPSWKGTAQTDSEQQVLTKLSANVVNQDGEANEGGNSGRSSSLPRNVVMENKKCFSGPLMPDDNISSKKIVGDENRDFVQPKHQSERNYSGPLLYRQRRETNNLSSGSFCWRDVASDVASPLDMFVESVHAAEDLSEGAVVQRKGRFKVTSADLNPKGPTNCYFNSVCGGSSSPSTSSLTAASVLPSLQCILQQNIMQREEILKLIKYVEQSSDKQMESTEAATNDLLQILPASARERELQAQLINLQQSAGNLVEELQRQKMKNTQLERRLNALVYK
ncbi:serine/threonine-protein kinase BLUS1 isoform X1 [Hevea brasiliensis]|uniref:serine/threonine-protein kinase BLUS1 isoform X1 n=1 Tax=Hevea brasiliensis TaxID=3981 RepID=UPI0025E90115|nr:serine/threonine-protein kinase BLUS1 isoform X1 [Hevea brasiliensis]XP_021649451.2 serine/threonine-protein kinase BLUS1 isoform X1 [Hevea brasiliensis]XP_021649452.2 serine/threonine-protein kinase BLUS1 isoform X1 [Hevea brasiliensis]